MGLPASTQTHHVFPQDFRKRFHVKWGINVDNPRYLTWWKADTHLPNAKNYNLKWDRFFRTTPAREEILNFGKELMVEYGIKVNY